MGTVIKRAGVRTP